MWRMLRRLHGTGRRRAPATARLFPTLPRLLAPLALALAGGAAIPATAALAQPPSAPSPTDARLEGSFLLAGQVTVAKNVRGEHVGEHVTRVWRFTSLCPAGQCQTVVLVRRRHAGTDTVTLERRAPGHYAGKGRFSAPLVCGGQRYPRGALIPFTITVRIDAAIVQNGAVVAGRVSATYTNRRRVNRTPCLAGLGHDAATYHGHLLAPL